MELRVFVEPQRGTTYRELRRLARHAEDRGFGAVVCADHYANTVGPTRPPGPVDAWTTLAALSVETSTIRIGTMMSPATFRSPGQLAVVSAQVDQMSGGRVDLGLGAGWFAAEHDAYGIPFPDLATRFDRLAEQLAILRAYWSTPAGDTFDFAGAHYRLRGCPALPKARQAGGPWLSLGGTGTRRTPALVAEFANEFNVPFPDLDMAASRFAAVDGACHQIGRDPTTVTRSVVLSGCVGADDDSVARRVALVGPDVARARASGLVGSPAEVVDTLGRWQETTGVRRVYVHLTDISDVQQMDLISGQVMPQLPERDPDAQAPRSLSSQTESR
jgi:alkanesulfonate monooxygenase